MIIRYWAGSWPIKSCEGSGVLPFFNAKVEQFIPNTVEESFKNAHTDRSSCRGRARGNWLRFLAELCHPIRNGSIFRPDAYNGVSDFHLGDPQSSASRISTNPTNRGSVSDLH